MMFLFCITCWILNNFIFGVINGEEVFLEIVLFDNQRQQGPNLTLTEVRGCVNLPSDWNDKVSSLVLYGRCLRLYKDQECRGRMVTIVPANRLWLTDLKLINFNDMLSSISSCKPQSPKLESGRYAIQTTMDNGVLTVRRLVGGYTLLRTLKWKKDFAQQWDLETNDDGTYLLTPRMFEHNLITYNNGHTKEYPTERVNWIIESLYNQMYVLKKHSSNLCLTMRPKMETVLKECRKDEPTQQWIFHRLGSE